jgi:hypothetical protein
LPSGGERGSIAPRRRETSGMGRIARGLMAALLLAMPIAAAPAWAETHTESIIAEQRTSVSLRVAPEAVQALLPAGWVTAAAEGASNISFIFMDRKLALAPDGKPLHAGTNRVLVISATARNVETGQVRGLIVGGYSTDPAGVPGAYRVYGNGVVDVVRNERVAGMSENTVQEQWSVKAADGGTLRVNLTFQRAAPTYGTFELQVYSGADPSFYRIYRGKQITDVVRNRASGVDRVTSVEVTAQGGKLGAIIGERAEVIGVSNSPYYSRETFLP